MALNRTKHVHTYINEEWLGLHESGIEVGGSFCISLELHSGAIDELVYLTGPHDRLFAHTGSEDVE